MENIEGVSLKKNITFDKDYSKALEGLRSLDRQLEYLHSNNYYVSKLDADSIIYTNCYGFDEISKIDKSNRAELVNKNVKDLVKLSLGIFVSLDVEGNIFYDYTKLDDNFIVQNYYSIRPSIKYGVDYYDNIVNSKLFNGIGEINTLYFNRAIEDITDKKEGRGNSVRMVKATPTGIALTELKDAAFVKTFFYPVIIISVLIVMFISYMLYTYL